MIYPLHGHQGYSAGGIAGTRNYLDRLERDSIRSGSPATMPMVIKAIGGVRSKLRLIKHPERARNVVGREISQLLNAGLI